MDCKEPTIESPEPVEHSIDPNTSMAAVIENVEPAKKKKNKKKENKVKEKTMEPKKNKAVPKHVRLMQEALAKRKEEEERQRKEEEERLRREEEERLRKERVEREAEEARIRRREKKKEIIEQKRRHGIPVTRKQKEDADKLKRFREHIESTKTNQNKDEVEVIDEEEETLRKEKLEKGPSKPIYHHKKSMRKNQVMEVAKEEPPAQPQVVGHDSDDKGDAWDDKSWEDHLEPEAVSRGTEKPRLIEVEIEVDMKKQSSSVSAAEESEPGNFLRSPICCIMGHVDAGKTKLLDCIRGTNVQKGEAGGITQQIGATYLPAENIQERIKELKSDKHMKVPGLLLIDTPGHEPFAKLRSRGSGLCDIAVLVVDIMDGLQPQTIESLNLLKSRNTEFIVALNKVDRLSGWKSCPNAPIVKAMKQQSNDVKNQFNERVVQIVTQFKEQGINTKVNFDENKRMRETYRIVPISAKSGEGIPDLLSLMVYWTQKSMAEKLTYSNEVNCIVLEVKYVEGLGTTIDVILVNGVLRRGDQIVVCGNHGTPIVTRIQSLLTPEPMKELRVKGKYQHHSEIKAAQAIKITSPQGFEHAIAGTSLYVVGPEDDLEEVKKTAMEDMENMMESLLVNSKSGSNSSSGDKGVCVQASTRGSLEAMLEFLNAQEVNTPVCGIGIGPIQKKDVRKASVMLEKKILAFDVKVTSEAQKLADELGVKIFVGDIIHEVIKDYMENLKEEKEKEKADVGEEAVFPCVLKILPNFVIRKKDPIIVGVKVLQGIVKVGTPICVPERDFVDIGRIESIENNHRRVDMANKGEEVCIKIVGMNPNQQQVMCGRHFNIEDELVSHISRSSIDVLKSCYRDVLSQEIKLVSTLKTIFKIL